MENTFYAHNLFHKQHSEVAVASKSLTMSSLTFDFYTKSHVLQLLHAQKTRHMLPQPKASRTGVLTIVNSLRKHTPLFRSSESASGSFLCYSQRSLKQEWSGQRVPFSAYSTALREGSINRYYAGQANLAQTFLFCLNKPTLPHEQQGHIL